MSTKFVYGVTALTRLLPVLAIALCASCTHRVESVSHSSVSTVMSRQVQNAVDAGEGDLELKRLRQRLAANPQDLDARILLARLYMSRGLPDLALEHERLAAQQFPDSSVAALELAKTLRQMQQPEEALKAAGDFLAKHPSSSWELLSLDGILQDERGDFARGEQAYRAALAIDGSRSALHNNLGYNLLLQGKAEDSAAEFRKAIDLDARSEIAHNNLAAALIAEKAPAEALARWQKELQKTSGPAAAHNNLAAVLMEQGRYDEARAELDAALQAQKDYPPAVANLKLLAERDGKPPARSVAQAAGQPAGTGFWKKVTSSLGWFVTP